MRTNPPSPRVIEIGEVTAGIVVPEEDGRLRFFSAQRPFDPLDRRTFRSLREATEAARARLAQVKPLRSPKPRQALAPRPQREGDATADRFLAA